MSSKKNAGAGAAITVLLLAAGAASAQSPASAIPSSAPGSATVWTRRPTTS